jgi:repressor LexA
MINAGILPEDIVIVRPQDTADHGQIVVALLEEEATVKRLYRKDGKVLLLPENPAYEPIEAEEIRILGRVKGVVRNYS